MNAQPEHRTVRALINLYKSEMLKVNPEYQRGTVWSSAQQKRLVDSVLRGYPIPLFYFHHINEEVEGFKRNALEIIDGQQRMHSLFMFHEGALKLFDPESDAKQAKFPEFVRREPCPWAHDTFNTLSDDLRDRFLDAELSTVEITTDDPNEARDLFIRLQGGLPLRAQEKRDAWPGNFTDYVLRLGGKPEIARYPGHEFFRKIMRLRPGSDRGKTRQTAAQIAMLFLSRRRSSEFADINSRALDDFYYDHLDFEQDGQDARDLDKLLSRLTDLLGDGKRPKMSAPEAAHLVLLADQLNGEFAPGWQDRLPSAVDTFHAELVAAKKRDARDADPPPEFWSRFGIYTVSSSDQAARIKRRHEFYVEKMLGYLAPLQRKDPKRGFDPSERELVYFRDRKLCAVCGGTVAWDDVEIHHINEHAKGGETTFENAALVHGACHPKGGAAVEFAVSRTTS